MKQLIVGVVAVSVGACSPLAALTGGPAANGPNETLKTLGEHIDRCDRHYQGGFGLGASFTFNIDCKSQPAPDN